MEELNIDASSPDFKFDDMIAKFEYIANDDQTHFFKRDRFRHLITITKKHKFWDSQPIELSTVKIKKEGEI